MAIQDSFGGPSSNERRKSISLTLFRDPPFTVDLFFYVEDQGNKDKMYLNRAPMLSLTISKRVDDETLRKSCVISVNDYYKFLMIVESLLKKAGKIFVNGVIDPSVDTSESYIVTYKQECVKVVPVIDQTDDGKVEAFRIMLNDEGCYVDMSVEDAIIMHQQLSTTNPSALAYILSLMKG
jgi:hypothetical protein